MLWTSLMEGIAVIDRTGYGDTLQEILRLAHRPSKVLMAVNLEDTDTIAEL